MAKTHDPADLYDPRRGAAAVRIFEMEVGLTPVESPRTNCFTIYHVESGAGRFWADAGQHAFGPGMLLFLTPYQYFRFEAEQPVTASVVQFHANFLCIETFHAESGCAGMLFNDPYHPPLVELDKPAQRQVTRLIKDLRHEQSQRGLAYEEMLLAQLKILLVLATRLKSQFITACPVPAGDVRHPALAELKQLIEEHYRTLHAPADYAAKLFMSPKTLGRIVREQLGKSLTDLIRERILTEAKWQILHTLKPVKEIAREVGFGDELYFSRMFKKATGYSPTFFREFETEIRGGSNLSMLSPPAPILAGPVLVDNSVS